VTLGAWPVSALLLNALKSNETGRAQEKEGCGQGQNRTADTRIFSPLLYRLSYLARSLETEILLKSRSESRFGTTLDEFFSLSFDEIYNLAFELCSV
jgi:hypothetical protein